MEHISDCPSVLPSDILPARGTVVEDVASPSQIMVSLLPLVAAVAQDDDFPSNHS
jgi:hypothetical protein